MQKIILIFLTFIFSNSIYADGFYSNNNLLTYCQESTYFCDGYFAGFLDGLFSLTKLKDDASISPTTLKRMYYQEMINHPSVGDFHSHLTLRWILENDGYAIKSKK